MRRIRINITVPNQQLRLVQRDSTLRTDTSEDSATMPDPSIPIVNPKIQRKLVGHNLLYSVSAFLSIGVWLFG